MKQSLIRLIIPDHEIYTVAYLYIVVVLSVNSIHLISSSSDTLMNQLHLSSDNLLE